MLRSKSRSGTFDFGGKRSVLSRTFSASRICRGDPLIEKEAHVSVAQGSSVERRPSAKIVNSSENGVVRVSTMQMQMNKLDEDMKLMKDQLDAVREERDRAFDELRESKLVAHEAKMRLSKVLSPRKAGEDKDSSLHGHEELRIVKAAETRALNLYAESKKRIHKLEEEIERGKQSESKMFESIVSQTKQLEVTKIELEESKLEIAFLQEKLDMVRNSSPAKDYKDLNDLEKGALESLRSELQETKANLAHAQEGEKSALSQVSDLMDEIEMLKIELHAAVEAEEKSEKAMEHLALALKEVATESNLEKQKVCFTELELEQAREDAEKLKAMLRENEESYAKLLHEAKQENMLQQNTVERLRQEAEESLLAWNGKEMGFVDVIKEAVEERDILQQEKAKLYESLKAAESGTRRAKDDNHKLRDILKQALHEVKLSTEAAAIAREENSELTDTIADKDEAIRFLVQENARLQIDGAASDEKMKELKRLRTAAFTESKVDNEETGVDSEVGTAKFLSPESVFEDNCKEETRNELTHMLKLEALKESVISSSPVTEARSPKTRPYNRKKSFSLKEDTEANGATDIKHPDSHVEKNSQRTTALLQRFGDILMMKSLHRKEPTTTYHH
ncbi:putative WEB family protein, chloroplastic [Heracleum sosnowskyi]|uniref:WEB family protein, chloroplastic n=1 Tax=Heracleum sosnowskyi TaxID=360622 RepID=A0AAD8HPH4_9APIA|nr:putative WEB family protein, chloroplastic [Heracleum sosnowskyi]